MRRPLMIILYSFFLLFSVSWEPIKINPGWFGLGWWIINQTAKPDAFIETDINCSPSNPKCNPLQEWVSILGQGAKGIVQSSASTEVQQRDEFFRYVTTWVNIVLSLMFLICIAMVIYYGVQILTSAWDDWRFQKGISWLKHTAYWLIWLWLSYFIVEFIFSFVWWWIR